MFNVSHRRSSLLDQITLNKENVPPQLTSYPRHKSTRKNGFYYNTIITLTYEHLEEAMDAIKRNVTSLRGRHQI